MGMNVDRNAGVGNLQGIMSVNNKMLAREKNTVHGHTVVRRSIDTVHNEPIFIAK